MGYARCTSFQSYRASVCYYDDDNDPSRHGCNETGYDGDGDHHGGYAVAQDGMIMLGTIGIRGSGMSAASGGGYYDDVDMDEYWAGPGPVVKLRGSL